MEPIGWIGTGALGTAIVRRLLEQNVSVVVYNRTEEKTRSLVEKGATLASSPRAVAQECNTIFLCPARHKKMVLHSCATARGMQHHFLMSGRT